MGRGTQRAARVGCPHPACHSELVEGWAPGQPGTERQKDKWTSRRVVSTALTAQPRPAHTHVRTQANTHRGVTLSAGDPWGGGGGRIPSPARLPGSPGDSTHVDTPHTSQTQTHSTTDQQRVYTQLAPQSSTALTPLSHTHALSPFPHHRQAHVTQPCHTRVQVSMMVFTQNQPVAP